MLTEKQIEERRRGLGGSDSAVILGASPFVTLQDLWADKMGLTAPAPPNAAMERGTYLERVAAEKYERDTGRKLKEVKRTLYYRKNKLFFGHIDRRIVGDSRGDGPLEIKCPGLRTFARVKAEGLPAYYQVQAQHYMMVTGADWGSIAVFNAERWEVFWVDIERDEELIQLIQEEGEKFWRNHVLTGIAPDPGSVAPPPEADLPPIPSGAGQLVKLDSSEWAAAVEELRMAKELKAATEEIEKAAREKVINLFQQTGATAIEGGGARIYFQEQRARTSFDLKGFSKAHPELKEEIERYQRRTSPFKVLRPYFFGEKQIE